MEMAKLTPALAETVAAPTSAARRIVLVFTVYTFRCFVDDALHYTNVDEQVSIWLHLQKKYMTPISNGLEASSDCAKSA